MALNINDFAKPIWQVDIEIGTVYLYQADENVRKLFRSLKLDTPAERGRKVFSRIISLEKRVKLKDEIKPIPDEIFSVLKEGDVALISEKFRQLNDRNCALSDKDFPKIPPQNNDESGFEFFDRVLGTDIANADKEYKEQMKKIMDVTTSSASGLLSQLNLSSDRLGGTVREFSEIAIKQPVFHNHFGDMNRRIAQERSEDRNVAQLTGEMTKQSAEMLQELVKAASAFLIRFDERDQKSDKQIQLQLWVALGSLALSVLLAGVGVWFAAKSYYQDFEKNKEDDANKLIQVERDKKIDRLLEQNSKTLQAVEFIQEKRTKTAPIDDVTRKN
nr:hypothetical protein [uncultured Undibacterium sp.]